MPKWKGKAGRITKGPAHVRYCATSYRTIPGMQEKIYCTKYAANGMRQVYRSILPHPDRLMNSDPSLYSTRHQQASEAAMAWFKVYGANTNNAH